MDSKFALTALNGIVVTPVLIYPVSLLIISSRKSSFWPCRVLLRRSLCESTHEAAWQSQKTQTHLYTQPKLLTSYYYPYVMANRQFCVSYLFQKNTFSVRSSVITSTTLWIYTPGCLAGLGDYHTFTQSWIT